MGKQMRSHPCVTLAAMMSVFMLAPLWPGQSANAQQAEETPIRCDGENVRALPDGGRIRTLGWTGYCASGLADGEGRFITRRESATGAVIQEISHEGHFVAGRLAGLVCISNLATADSRGRLVPLPENQLWCAFPGSMMALRRVGDAWVQLDSSVQVPAAVVNAEHTRLIAAARAGRSELPQLSATNPAFAGLLGGARITERLDPNLSGLEGKRIAIVLSTRAIEQLEGWRVDRQSLLSTLRASASSERGLAPALSYLEEVSDPADFVVGAAATVQAAGGLPFAADDLSVLQDGRADYVLVLDWTYEARIPMSARAFANLPACGTAGPCEQSTYLRAQTGVYLISPQFHVVFQSAGWPYTATRSQEERSLTEMVQGLAAALRPQFSIENRFSLPGS